MIKPMVGGLIGALLYLSPAVAQNQDPQQDPQFLAQAFTQKGAAETVSLLELQQFAQALNQLRAIEMETQKKITEALKEEKLSPERFQEIGQSSNNPDFSVSTQISPVEQQRFEKALAKIQTIRQEIIPKQSRAITLQGLTVERFSQIGQAIDKNPALKQQLQNGRFWSALKSRQTKRFPPLYQAELFSSPLPIWAWSSPQLSVIRTGGITTYLR